MEKQFNNKKILLHICCGICGLHVIEKLKENFNELVLYFYNPNIHPKEEYERRLSVVRKIAEIGNYKLIEGEYNFKEWFIKIKGFENEPEGGVRCFICYKIRLENSAKIAKENGCEWLATTLTISPHKKASVINPIGIAAAEKFGINFLEKDFKKQDGFKKTTCMAKEHNFYRQNYCGCVWSGIDKIKQF